MEENQGNLPSVLDLLLVSLPKLLSSFDLLFVFGLQFANLLVNLLNQSPTWIRSCLLGTKS